MGLQAIEKREEEEEEDEQDNSGSVNADGSGRSNRQQEDKFLYRIDNTYANGICAHFPFMSQKEVILPTV